jgi:hypothetical protein
LDDDLITVTIKFTFHRRLAAIISDKHDTSGRLFYSDNDENTLTVEICSTYDDEEWRSTKNLTDPRTHFRSIILFLRISDNIVTKTLMIDCSIIRKIPFQHLLSTSSENCFDY